MNICIVYETKFMASMDVESRYRSLKSEDTAEIIKETVVESELEITNINVKELLIFLRKNMSNSEINKTRGL